MGACPGRPVLEEFFATPAMGDAAAAAPSCAAPTLSPDVPALTQLLARASHAEPPLSAIEAERLGALLGALAGSELRALTVSTTMGQWLGRAQAVQLDAALPSTLTELSLHAVHGAALPAVARVVAGGRLARLELSMHAVEAEWADVLVGALRECALAQPVALRAIYLDLAPPLSPHAAAALLVACGCIASARGAALASVALPRCGLGAAGPGALGGFLRGSRAVTHLHLRSNALGDAGALALADELPAHARLRALDLSANGIGAAGAVRLGGALSRLTDVEELLLGLNGRLGDAGAAALASALLHHTRLRVLDLSQGIGADPGTAPAAAAEHSGVAASGGGGDADGFGGFGGFGGDGTARIGDAGATALAAALRGLAHLESLRLQRQAIGDVGAAALGAALGGAAAGALRELGLLGNGIGDGGARALAPAVRACVCLEDLSIGGALGPAGAQALARAVRGHGALRSLCLDHNSALGDAGGAALADALPSVPRLETLQLYDTGLADAGAQALARALRGAGALHTLELRQNPRIGRAGRAALRKLGARRQAGAAGSHSSAGLRLQVDNPRAIKGRALWLAQGLGNLG